MRRRAAEFPRRQGGSADALSDRARIGWIQTTPRLAAFRRLPRLLPSPLDEHVVLAEFRDLIGPNAEQTGKHFIGVLPDRGRAAIIGVDCAES